MGNPNWAEQFLTVTIALFRNWKPPANRARFPDLPPSKLRVEKGATPYTPLAADSIVATGTLPPVKGQALAYAPFG